MSTDNREERAIDRSPLTPLRSQPEAVRSLLPESLPWSPLDFIRGMSPVGDRAVQFQSLLRDLDATNDLRFTYPIASDTDVAVCAERLVWDTKFFGYGVARLHGVFPLKKNGYSPSADYAPAIDALCRLARARGIRYLFAVIDARDLPSSRALTGAGFALVETRLFYHLSVRDYRYPRRFRVRLATDADVDGLSALARTAGNPFDRFNADPFIAGEDALRLMEAWIRASVLEGFADATFVPDSPDPQAFCTVKYHADKAALWETSIAQVVLAMATPGSPFLGMVSELNYHLSGLGVEHVFFSTQITNRPIIRVGEHLGFKYGRGEYVFRLLL